jgi:hypothetical protein
MSSATMSKVERLSSQLRTVKNELKQGARVGTLSMLTVGGGVIAGWCYAKHPVVPNTTFPLAGALGSGLVLGAMANLFDDYSDSAASVGSGLLAVAVAKEAEKYFED